MKGKKWFLVAVLALSLTACGHKELACDDASVPGNLKALLGGITEELMAHSALVGSEVTKIETLSADQETGRFTCQAYVIITNPFNSEQRGYPVKYYLSPLNSNDAQYLVELDKDSEEVLRYAAGFLSEMRH